MSSWVTYCLKTYLTTGYIGYQDVRNGFWFLFKRMLLLVTEWTVMFFAYVDGFFLRA